MAKKSVNKPAAAKKGTSKPATGKAKLYNATGVTKAAYDNAMARIEEVVQAGNGTIRSRDMAEYKRLAVLAESYESTNITIEQPTTLEGILEWQMFEKRMKQKELAKALHISDAKLSLVMSGKQRPDVTLLKNIHEVLGVDGNLLLDAIAS